MGVLGGCGKFSESLSSMAKTIIEGKKLRGEKIGEKEIQEIEERVFRSYQLILGIATDAESISLAIENMEKAVKNGNVEVEKIAVGIAQKATDYVSHLDDNDSREMKETTMADVIEMTQIAFIEESNSTKNPISQISLLFNESLTEKMDTLFHKIRNGDDGAIVAFYTMEHAMTFYNVKSENLTEKDKAIALSFLKKLTVANSTTCAELRDKLAKKWKFDVFEKGENEEFVFSEQKFKEIFQQINPSEAAKSDEYFVKAIQKSAQEQMKKRNYNFNEDMTVEDWKRLQEERFKEFDTRKKVLTAMKDGDVAEIKKAAVHSPGLVMDMKQKYNEIYEKMNNNDSNATEIVLSTIRKRLDYLNEATDFSMFQGNKYKREDVVNFVSSNIYISTSFIKNKYDIILNCARANGIDKNLKGEQEM